jgi:hypothetical protein
LEYLDGKCTFDNESIKGDSKRILLDPETIDIIKTTISNRKQKEWKIEVYPVLELIAQVGHHFLYINGDSYDLRIIKKKCELTSFIKMRIKIIRILLPTTFAVVAILSFFHKVTSYADGCHKYVTLCNICRQNIEKM